LQCRSESDIAPLDCSRPHLNQPPTSQGVAYLPDAADGCRHLAPIRRSPLLQGLCFIAVFLLLQILWSFSRDTAVEHFLIDRMTVLPAAALINQLTPAVHALATGSRILANGGGINILNGCEGTEVLMLLIAAFFSAPLSWRSRLSGTALGVLIVLTLNQVRIVCLFYAFRADHSLFDLLHTMVAPLTLIAATGFYFYVWLYLDARRLAAPA
jgi:exosortase/archaeosortase family protein